MDNSRLLVLLHRQHQLHPWWPCVLTVKHSECSVFALSAFQQSPPKSNIYFVRSHKPMLAFCVSVLLPLSIFDCATEGTAGLKAGQSLIKTGFKLTQNQQQFCAMSLKFMGFFICCYSAVSLLTPTNWKRYRQCHQRGLGGPSDVKASLLGPDPVYPPLTTPFFDLLTAADGKDMSLEL